MCLSQYFALSTKIRRNSCWVLLILNRNLRQEDKQGNFLPSLGWPPLLTYAKLNRAKEVTWAELHHYAEKSHIRFVWCAITSAMGVLSCPTNDNWTRQHISTSCQTRQLYELILLIIIWCPKIKIVAMIWENMNDWQEPELCSPDLVSRVLICKVVHNPWQFWGLNHTTKVCQKSQLLTPKFTQSQCTELSQQIT